MKFLFQYISSLKHNFLLQLYHLQEGVISKLRQSKCGELIIPIKIPRLTVRHGCRCTIWKKQVTMKFISLKAFDWQNFIKTDESFSFNCYTSLFRLTNILLSLMTDKTQNFLNNFVNTLHSLHLYNFPEKLYANSNENATSVTKIYILYICYAFICEHFIYYGFISFHYDLHTVDGFIFMGTNFRGLNKNYAFLGFIIHGNSIFLHNSYRNRHFVATGIHGSDPPRKPRKLVPNEN